MSGKRVSLGNGQWFDVTKAKSYPEDTYWDGNNNISKATGSQWDHEKLYHTAKGRWVLNAWSQRQGSGEDYNEISTDEAVAWLIRNGHDVEALGLDDVAAESEI